VHTVHAVMKVPCDVFDMTRVQAEQASRAYAHPLNFVSLNRITVDRPSVYDDATSSSSSSQASAYILSHGLHPAPRPPEPRSHSPHPTAAPQASVAATNLRLEAGPAPSGSQDSDKASDAKKRSARAREDVAERIARLFGTAVEQKTLSRKEVLARVRARPGFGGSPTSQFVSKLCAY
jgi:hypothetical protein